MLVNGCGEGVDSFLQIVGFSLQRLGELLGDRAEALIENFLCALHCFAVTLLETRLMLSESLLQVFTNFSKSLLQCFLELLVVGARLSFDISNCVFDTLPTVFALT